MFQIFRSNRRLTEESDIVHLMHIQEAELEDFLFAGNAGDISGFGKEDEELDRRSALAHLIAKVRKGKL